MKIKTINIILMMIAAFIFIGGIVAVIAQSGSSITNLTPTTKANLNQANVNQVSYSDAYNDGNNVYFNVTLTYKVPYSNATGNYIFWYNNTMPFTWSMTDSSGNPRTFDTTAVTTAVNRYLNAKFGANQLNKTLNGGSVPIT